MAEIKTFGKRIELIVYSKGKDNEIDIVLDATGLRIDFNLNNTTQYNRGTFSIYNLNPEVIKQLSSGEKYVSLQVGMHGSDLATVGNDFYISNATTETILPNTITTLYCISGNRRTFLEKQLNASYEGSTLEDDIKMIVALAKESKIKVEYLLFPDYILKHKTYDAKTHRISASIENTLKRLSIMYHFQYFMKGDLLRIVYKADSAKSYSDSIEGREPKEFSIDVLNIKANPIVGVGTMTLDLNLAPNIFPGDVFDTENFITASNDVGLEYLTAVSGDIKSTVTKYSKFQVWNVVHRGSNYTAEWNTIVQSFTARDGNRVSTNRLNWYGRS